MICPKCGKVFDVETRYSPSREDHVSPYLWYMHSYDLSVILKGGVCRHSMKVKA